MIRERLLDDLSYVREEPARAGRRKEALVGSSVLALLATTCSRSVKAEQKIPVLLSPVEPVAAIVVTEQMVNPEVSVPAIKVYPTPLPTAVSTQPEVAPSPESERVVPLEIGLAWPHQTDRLSQNLEALNMSWFFTNWNPELLEKYKDIYIPITRCGLVSELEGLPKDYDGYLLVFNEPNLPEPNGCPLTPEVAAGRYRALREAFPNTKMVVGNVSAWEISDWLSHLADLVADNPPYAWGVHGYVEKRITPEYISDLVNNFITEYSNSGRIWVTEAGVCSGNIEVLKTFLEELVGIEQIERIAFYTDNQPDGVSWGICDGRINLKDGKGGLTPMGETIRDWPRD